MDVLFSGCLAIYVCFCLYIPKAYKLFGGILSNLQFWGPIYKISYDTYTIILR